MHFCNRLAVFLTALLVVVAGVQKRLCAQKFINPDSIAFSKLKIKNSKVADKLFQQAINSVKRTPPEPGVYVGRSEDPYMPFQGKIIRHISVRALSFNQSFKDTAQREKSSAVKLADMFHANTRKRVVRNNVFIREGTELNAYKLADNERFIRSLDYINDVRFVIKEVPGSQDSVDIMVITKDLFSIGGGAAADGLNRINANLYEANLGGMAQRVEVNGLYDVNRHPNTGFGALYRKRNAFGSFVDGTIGFNNVYGSPFTRQEEKQQYLSLSRPLISPYTKLAGGFTISHNFSYNMYSAPEIIFHKYDYKYLDVWGGYNIAIDKLTATNNTIRDRRFFSLRYFTRRFSDVPAQVGQRLDPFFNNTDALLAQITFFRQDYFRTQYIYGFGTTEDLPYGYNVSATVGLHRQLDLVRPYAGVSATRYLATSRGDFLQFYCRAGTFIHNGEFEDASTLVGATGYSRLFFIGSTKVRQYFNLSYGVISNRKTVYPLRLNNPFGLRGFLSDSAYGDRRLSLQLETAFYLKFRLLGFRFAPFPYADISLLTPQNSSFSNAQLYASLGGGVRFRNENLVFQTIEIRAYYFPIAPANMRDFKVITSDNIQYRYPSSFITAPDVVQMN